MPGRDELPQTLERSEPKAQRTWIKAHDSAVESYGEGERAHRTAFAALKHTFQRFGDRWVRKARRGPSDAQAALTGAEAREADLPTFGGVDVAGSSRRELEERAKALGVKGRSRMTKEKLGRAIARRQ